MTAVPHPQTMNSYTDESPSSTGRIVRFDHAHGRPSRSGSLTESIQDLHSFLDADPSAASQRIVGRSAALRQIIELATRYAGSSAPVLICGESGTGKEAIARLLHNLSPRNEQPYVQVNCAALSESLIESELFGHEKGAFTGAAEAHQGKFESADGGTLLLDEIGEMPHRQQTRLLRVLEECEFQRVGGNRIVRVDTRVIATTNRDLEQEVSDGVFRLDLFHRLSVLTLRIPPLRERRDDIPDLVAWFVSQFQSEASQPIHAVSEPAMLRLTEYEWPGNVRELRNAVRHACVVNESGTIELTDLPESCQVRAAAVTAVTPATGRNAAPSHGDCHSALPVGLETMPLDEIERRVILETLRRFAGNKSDAATHLGITARTIANKLKRYREEGLI